ncbi:MAG: Stf0 family sulfotransferase [Myxococcota bacterium]|nr:Stf0 family sulfotransferase [Myxococcota bacterium]
MELYENQFDEKHDFSKQVEAEKTLIIASTPRCGSHMLGHALYETGCFGFPLEYVNPANLDRWKQRLRTSDLSDTLSALRARRTSGNGVFAIKVHYSHLAQFDGFERLLSHFRNPSFVLLTRKKALDQAVSLSIANQTGVWISGQKGSGVEPEYQFDAIDRGLRSTLAQNAAWRYLLIAHGCRFFEMNFDEVRRSLEPSIAKIADFMDIDLPEGSVPKEQVTRQQGQSRNTAWVSRYLEDFGGGELDMPRPAGPSFFQRVRKKLLG